MSSFITNLFPSSQGGKHDNIMPIPPPPLHTRSSQNEAFNNERPNTPNRNSFITPVSTPQGSPSKNRNPPGANDLPVAFESSMKLTPNTFGSPTKTGRSQAGTPLSPGKSNAMAIDDSYFANSPGNIDDSIIHKSAAISPGSPLRKQGKENTPPTSRQGLESSIQNQAALSRQELYQPREQQPTRKYNTQRGLTVDELEILNKPNVKRLANVTQLCEYRQTIRFSSGLTAYRFPRLLLRPLDLCGHSPEPPQSLQSRIPRTSCN
jgi:cell cycle protein kinase DBF2